MHRTLLRCFVLAAGLAVWHTPLTAQEGMSAMAAWSPRFEAHVGYLIPTRDIGKILGSEVDAQIRTELTRSVLFSAGVLFTTNSPKYSLRGLVGYTSTTAEGQSGTCTVVSGPGCLVWPVDADVLSFTGDVLIHNDRGESTLRYFFAGFGVRRYSFQETGCVATDDLEYKVCNPMEEFLSDQYRPVGRLGVGIRKRLPQASFFFEAADLIGGFTGSGIRGEGGIQNDLLVRAGISFPGG